VIGAHGGVELFVGLEFCLAPLKPIILRKAH